MTNIYFVSHLDDKSFVSAVGLGNLIMNSMVIAVIYSLNAVIETLASQAAGTGNYEICGVYLNRAILVNTLSFVLLSIPLCNAKTILVNLGQAEHISALTEQYLIFYIPGIYMYGMCDLYRRYLNCFKKNFLPMISFAVSVGLHPFWINHFMHRKGMGFLGITVAGCVTNLSNFILIQILYKLQSDLKATHVPFDRRTV